MRLLVRLCLFKKYFKTHLFENVEELRSTLRPDRLHVLSKSTVNSSTWSHGLTETPKSKNNIIHKIQKTLMSLQSQFHPKINRIDRTIIKVKNYFLTLNLNKYYN